MLKNFTCILMLTACLGLFLFISANSPAQMIDSVASDHVRMRLPVERGSLGRDIIADLERCYLFMNRATGGGLPRRILVAIDWNQRNSICNRRDATILLGMNQSGASANPKQFLLHEAGREMARMGLLDLSEGAEREDNKFLFEGMIEILFHDFGHTSRSIESAWAIAHLLDEMKLLGLTTQRYWSGFSGDRRCLRSAAPGITFLTTIRELQGRDRLPKFFELIGKSPLIESLTVAFKAPAAELEAAWLKRVREYTVPDELLVATEDAPELLQTSLSPGTVRPGAGIQVRLLMKDRAGNLLPEGVFIKDEHSGTVIQPTTESSGYLAVTIPVKEDCAPGEYSYRVTAVDEGGNLRTWPGSYKVVAK
jgi:hypothetical protein